MCEVLLFMRGLLNLCTRRLSQRKRPKARDEVTSKLVPRDRGWHTHRHHQERREQLVWNVNIGRRRDGILRLLKFTSDK